MLGSDLVGDVGEPCGVETVALWTGAADELVEEGDGLLRRVGVVLVLHHTRLRQ